MGINTRMPTDPPGEELLEHHDVDFYWSAPDGSQTFAHWLVGKYSQLVYNYSNNEVQDQARNTPFSSNHAVIAQYIYDSYKLNSQYDHSKYVFLPLHGDGAPPPPLSLLKSWFMEFDKINKNKKVKLVIASFDQYARLVQAEMGDHGTGTAICICSRHGRHVCVLSFFENQAPICNTGAIGG